MHRAALLSSSACSLCTSKEELPWRGNYSLELRKFVVQMEEKLWEFRRLKKGFAPICEYERSLYSKYRQFAMWDCQWCLDLSIGFRGSCLILPSRIKFGQAIVPAKGKLVKSQKYYFYQVTKHYNNVLNCDKYAWNATTKPQCVYKPRKSREWGVWKDYNWINRARLSWAALYASLANSGLG